MGWLTQEKLDAIVKRTRGGGGEIVALLKTGSRLLRPGRLGDRDGRERTSRTRSACCPARAYLDGQYGVNDIYVGVPVLIGANGVEKIIEIAFDESEKAMFAKSVEAVQGLIDACKAINPALAELSRPGDRASKPAGDAAPNRGSASRRDPSARSP